MRFCLITWLSRGLRFTVLINGTEVFHFTIPLALFLSSFPHLLALLFPSLSLPLPILSHQPSSPNLSLSVSPSSKSSSSKRPHNRLTSPLQRLGPLRPHALRQRSHRSHVHRAIRHNLHALDPSPFTGPPLPNGPQHGRRRNPNLRLLRSLRPALPYPGFHFLRPPNRPPSTYQTLENHHDYGTASGAIVTETTTREFIGGEVSLA